MKITKAQLKEIIREELTVALDELGASKGAGMNLRAAQLGGTAGKRDDDTEVDPYERALEAPLAETEGKGCAESEGGSGCIKKRGDQWVILNNKKGGVWRKCDSEAHCEEILDAFHASRG
tara:strand:+ start:3218 stop:3577 length:360 start_codon:yes stop_codon:yes gene_type:complete